MTIYHARVVRRGIPAGNRRLVDRWTNENVHSESQNRKTSFAFSSPSARMTEMIRAKANAGGPIMTLNASARGPVVYLDNWAFINLAKGDAWRRQRFLSAVHSGVDLLFSVTNAAELSGPQGRSSHAIRAFLDEIGPRWFPAKHDPIEVIKCEIEGKRPDACCVDQHFLKSYVADRLRSYEPGCGNVIDLSSDFFRLGPILDRVGPQRASIYETSAEFDELLKSRMSAVHALSKRDPLLLDKKFPRIPFNAARPACFVYFNLLRIMAIEARCLKKGDGMDFCHAVVACAFASFATLDTRWKHRVASLPTPNRIARIYGPAELDQMVTDMESWARTTGH